MAGKRSATTDLNHDNWSQEEESEDAGTFQRASEEVLKKRVIKTARRRVAVNTTEGDDSGEKKNAFGGFTAFSKAPANPTSAFSFLKTAPATTTPNVNGTDKKQTPPSPQQTKDDKSDEFYAKLKGLNESVTNWIKKHVDENPFINLKPIFNDYEKYFNEIEAEKNKKPAVNFSLGKTSTGAENKNNTKNDVPQFSFGVKKGEEVKKTDFTFTSKTSEEVKTSSTSFGSKQPEFNFSAKTETEKPAQFDFGAKQTKPDFNFEVKKGQTPNFTFTSVNVPKGGSEPSFSFGAKKTETDKPTFSFNNSSFNFGSNNTGSSNPIVTSTPAPQNKEENDEDEPPKVEFTPVVEKDHVYTTECKVFVKKDGNYGDRGLGTLYIKPVPDSEKSQLIVRANTNLGNLLCNLILSSAIPTQRMGKKDVMLVCIPTPDSNPPPVPVLIRVKTPEKADELLKTLEKYKK